MPLPCLLPSIRLFDGLNSIMQSCPLIGIDYLVEKPEREDGYDRYSRKVITSICREEMREYAVFVFHMSDGIRLEIQKLIILVTSPRGSRIYGQPEGNGQANCSSGRKRNERDRHCLYIYLRLLWPENYCRNFDRTPVFSALRRGSMHFICVLPKGRSSYKKLLRNPNFVFISLKKKIRVYSEFKLQIRDLIFSRNSLINTSEIIIKKLL